MNPFQSSSRLPGGRGGYNSRGSDFQQVVVSALHANPSVLEGFPATLFASQLLATAH